MDEPITKELREWTRGRGWMDGKVIEGQRFTFSSDEEIEHVLGGIADRIDPTTTAHEDQPDELCCDKCGETFGRYTYGCDGREVRYCPACGRRITAIRDFGNSTQYELVAEEEGE